MDTLQFIFRERVSTGQVCIGCAEDPAFILIVLKDKRLVAEFGKDVTIMTDFISLVARRNDTAELSELRQAIFGALKYHPLFVKEATKKWISQYAN
jgi:hypothetical protein